MSKPMKFEKMRDQIPAMFFAQEFSKEFEKEAERQFGEIIPNDRPAFFKIARLVLIKMGEPSESA